MPLLRKCGGAEMLVVLDTNVLVSAFWSSGRKASDILNAVLSGRLSAVYDYRILEEYRKVLHYSKFAFSEHEISTLLEFIRTEGIAVAAPHIAGLSLPDEEDRKFLEVSRFCGAILITGNLKHFSNDPSILSVSEFWAQHL